MKYICSALKKEKRNTQVLTHAYFYPDHVACVYFHISQLWHLELQGL